MNKPSRTVATNTELNTRSVATQTIGDHSESEVSNTQKSSAEKKAAKRKARSTSTKASANSKLSSTSVSSDASGNITNHSTPAKRKNFRFNLTFSNPRGDPIIPTQAHSKSSNKSILSEMSMEHSDQPMTSKQAKERAHSVPHQSVSVTKKRNQSSPAIKHPGLLSPTMNDFPQKRSMQFSTIRKPSNPKSVSQISQDTNESAHLRFHFSELSSSPISPDHLSANTQPHPNLSSSHNNDTEHMLDHSPNSPNQTDHSIVRRMQNLAFQTPAQPRNANNIYIPEDSYQQHMTLNLTNEHQAIDLHRPLPRRSERLRIKNLRRLAMQQQQQHQASPPIRVDLKHVTFRRNNSGYAAQQERIKKMRKRN